MTTDLSSETEAGQMVAEVDGVPRWEFFVRDGGIDVSYRFEMLPLSALFVDYHEDLLNGDGRPRSATSGLLYYQRKQDKIKRQIVKEGVKADLFGALIVNAREESTYAVVDGGTRFRALRELQVPADVLIPCLVSEWDAMREIENYVHLNKERSGLTAVDIFVAQVKYGQEDAVNIQAILQRETGEGVGYGEKKWQCVSTIRASYAKGRLTNVLLLIRELGWLHQKSGRTQHTVGAIDRMLRLGADPDRALQKWANLTPASLMDEAKQQKDIAGQSRGVARLLALILGREYNKGIRPRTRALDLTSLSPRLSPQDDDDDE